MQRLVAVGLGDRDVILEASGKRLVQAVHGAEHAVAGVDLVDGDAEGVDVHDLVERPALAAHLLVDAVEVLLAAGDHPFQTFLGQAVDQRLLELADDLAAVAARLLHRLADAFGAHRVHGLEAEILELGEHAVHAEAVGDRCVDLQGFLGDAPALLAGQHLEGAHVVQAVGELDQDHADVAGHGHGHLLEVFRLRLGLGLEVHLGQLADPVDQFGDGLAELRAEGILGDAGVLDDVVQHGGHQALMVHVHVGEDAGDGQRMGDVGFAAAPALAVVGLLGVVVGAADQIDLIRGEVAAEPVGEGVYAGQGNHSRPVRAGTSGARRRPGNSDLLAVVVLEGGKQGSLFDDVLLQHHFVVDQAFGDFAQGDHGRLVVFPGYFRLLAAGCQLAGALAGEHDQLKTVIDVVQAVFDGDASHGVPRNCNGWARLGPGGLDSLKNRQWLGKYRLPRRLSAAGTRATRHGGAAGRAGAVGGRGRSP
ncbi:hypothetical protein D3C75_618860 [compost metagenome]